MLAMSNSEHPTRLSKAAEPQAFAAATWRPGASGIGRRLKLMEGIYIYGKLA